jgi:predicted enzyme related to lactoylglutathione lyase
MSIGNALASVAVKDVETARVWYAKLLGSEGTTPMANLAEWTFPRGGGLQLYQLPERAGHGSFTLVVEDIEAEVRKLDEMAVDTSERSSSELVKTVMITDPDGNHIALAESTDPSLAR